MTLAEPRLVELGAAAGRDRWTVTDGPDTVAVFVDGDAWRAVDAVCPHRGGPLAEGVLRDGGVVCPWHWYVFDLGTGACRNAAMTAVRTYAVVQRDGLAYALVPPRPPTLSLAERLRAHARGED